MRHKAVYLRIILQVHSTCFGCQPHTSSAVHKTVTTALATLATLRLASCREVAAQKIWPVPEAVVTVLCTPDDGCGWHPKHVEWTCRIINRLLCVASRWTVTNIYKIKFSSYNNNNNNNNYYYYVNLILLNWWELWPHISTKNYPLSSQCICN